jgi:hypothetical protein
MQKKQRRIVLQSTIALGNNNTVEYIIDSDEEPTTNRNVVSNPYWRFSLNSYLFIKENDLVTFEDNDSIMKQLRKAFKKSERVFFHGCYNIPADPLISDKERVKMTAQDVWKVTGYRFRYEKLKVMGKKV